jgi:hypothetical protein
MAIVANSSCSKRKTRIVIRAISRRPVRSGSFASTRAWSDVAARSQSRVQRRANAVCVEYESNSARLRPMHGSPGLSAAASWLSARICPLALTQRIGTPAFSNAACRKDRSTAA